jgi:hypothetical protein
MGRSIRTLRIQAETALIERTVFKAMAERDWELLIKIADIAQTDADSRLAQTDPSRFKLLRDGVTAWHLKGLTSITPNSIRQALKRHGIAQSSEA